MDVAQKLMNQTWMVRQFLVSDRPRNLVLGLQSNFNLSDDETIAISTLVGNVMIDKSPLVSELSHLDSKINAQKVDRPLLKFSILKAFFEQFSAEYPEVAQLKQEFASQAKTANPNQVTEKGNYRTTADIRPVKRSLPSRPSAPEGLQAVPPATPIKPAVPGPPPIKEEKPKLDQFQLRSVDDLIHVPPIVLAKEPNDEKQLVGRFKQEIQDIANYSGAKRTDIVAGWKQSQIYHTYIEMGNDSIQQGKPISDVMAFRKTSGKPYLTENQFHAISEVSRLLLR